MDWRESDPSEDDASHVDDSQATARKRSTRACDQCRKTKSKCERPMGEGVQCKSCSLAGTVCTFLGPSYKRGPPKGYIHAIEQRWHQVEALLGAILQCPDPRVQDIVFDLRQDDLAREILSRVDMGPYGPSGRIRQPTDATKEDFFASILRSNESSGARDPSRSRRQSRVSREIVSSSQDNGLSVVPTKQWQDNLSNRLASTSAGQHHISQESDALEDGVPVMQRRKLNSTSSGNKSFPSDWDSLYKVEPTSDDYNDPTEGLGELSLDEHQEVRFHGQASGLHILGQNLRTDDRMTGGVWRLPMARVWPPTKYGLMTQPSHEVNIPLPPLHIQDRLVDLYFTYIHPIFPIVHKGRFLFEYNSRLQTESMLMREPMKEQFSIPSTQSPTPDPSQEVTPLLLLAMFAITARFSEDDMPYPDEGKMWEAGCAYLDSALEALVKVFHCSRPSTVQALLLLGYREFGIGSMEQGWIFIGMAIRMAFDLGLNCNSEKWKIHGHYLFSPDETQARRQIWWGCIAADRYGSMYMGRPLMVKDEDFDTPQTHVDPTEETFPWQPYAPVDNVRYAPQPSRVMSTFNAAGQLSIILGVIISKVYPIRSLSNISRQNVLPDLESQLDQWYISLPDNLRYEASSRRPIPPPQILFLHIKYWGAVLLLHRGFIPNWKINDEIKSNVGSRAFDLAQAAASHISAIVTTYRETFSLKRTSPFFTSYLLSAAIMHILTLTMRPANIEATLGLQRCMAALKEMEIVWPSASRAWELLNGVQLRTDGNLSFQSSQPWERNKRGAEDAFGQEGSGQYPAPEGTSKDPTRQGSGLEQNGVQELSTRLMAHMLGLDIPGVEPSTSYYPGYEWWPRPSEGSSLAPSHAISPPPSGPQVPPINAGEMMLPEGNSLSQNNGIPSYSSYGYGPDQFLGV